MPCGKKVAVSGRLEKGDAAVHGKAGLVVEIVRKRENGINKGEIHASVTETKPKEHLLFNTHENLVWPS